MKAAFINAEEAKTKPLYFPWKAFAGAQECNSQSVVIHA